jgi:phosphoserine phosphatase RsbU/P
VLGDGRVLFAGAHEDILVCRADGPCQRVGTIGTWLGIVEDLTLMPDLELQLHPGDVMLLHSDGVTQAMNGAGEQFGMNRLCAAFERLRTEPVTDIVAGLFAEVEAWTAVQHDDVTVLVVRYHGPPGSGLS